MTTDTDRADAPRRWVERWAGSGPDRGWSIWEADHGERIAYIGEGEHSGRVASLIAERHNAARAAPPAPVPTDAEILEVVRNEAVFFDDFTIIDRDEMLRIARAVLAMKGTT